ncbi:hypothetical protein Tco_0169262 [Tanacetum coccineum]
MMHKLHLLLTLMQLQILRTWLDINLDCSLTEIRSCNDHGAQPKWKQVSEITYCMKYAIHKTPKKWINEMKLKPEFLSVDVKTGYMDDNAVDGHTWRFIKICKESCEDENVVEAYKKMLDFYNGQMKPKKNTKAVNLDRFTEEAHVETLDVALYWFVITPGVRLVVTREAVLIPKGWSWIESALDSYLLVFRALSGKSCWDHFSILYCIGVLKWHGNNLLFELGILVFTIGSTHEWMMLESSAMGDG